ncbi:DNA mismatch repair protein MutL [Melghiribacillus thermohalophilus]|uniref:DNA mismatch repair protein MutL n=1 Tax=Melghiribacillus thermohalophilus TaxID=1324956 RepID=A0A4R3NCQ6_9BACI|nr:DNA mismatch repair endonuclease MutL [Melghiribacillus thermohalophilus]TCT26686.1 DNA mismatch repair protein MutL [Melghiribacillus thermohalophilus]
MGKIQLMPEKLANKIAAGEVVERPASVVKELVENSIDAGSSWIKVELEEAGLSLIKVMDDGEGMTEEDCVQAFHRHATSKIRTEDDLFRVRTLGFRGEALASIASVSRLTIRTSPGNQAGCMLQLDGGQIQQKDKTDARKGTEITVKDLFYNTPARLKYMKTIHTELGHVTDVLNRMALSHPDVRFECHHNGKRLFYTSGRGDLLQVSAQIYGIQTAKKMVAVKSETLDFTIDGFVAKPEVTRSNRNYISTIINGRYIKSHLLNKAVIEGYSTLLPIGKYPLAVLQIQMDPYLVDVNVHPAKLEVRFSKERELFEAVKEAVYIALKNERLIPEGKKTVKPRHPSYQPSFSFDQSSSSQDTRNKREEPTWNQWDRIKESNAREDDIQGEDGNAIKHVSRKTESHQEPVEKQSDLEESQKNTEQGNETRDENSRIPEMEPIGQLHGTYILAQNEEGLYIIDQHAAQERIKYEYYREQLSRPTEDIQELLVPITLDFTRKEALFLQDHLEQLNQIGLFMEPFGENSFIVRSHPAWFPEGEEEETIRELVDQILETQKIDLKKLRNDAAALMSCKRSIKANHYLNKNEMARLLNDLRACDEPYTCPHGRPIIIFFSEYELEKMFKRVM